MANYYDLGYEKGIKDFERDVYENPEDMVFDSAMSADECKDYQAGYFDGWCTAEEEWTDNTDAMIEEAYNTGYMQGLDDYPEWKPNYWDKIKYFEVDRLLGYQDGFKSREDAQDY